MLAPGHLVFSDNIFFKERKWFQIPEVSLMVMGALVLYALTKTWLGAVLWRLATIPVTIYLRLFPPRVRLLTREEYERQTEETTRRELRKLQEFCRSPEANSWKIAAKVHNPSKLVVWHVL